jgi:predicted nucleic acid-binding protein
MRVYADTSFLVKLLSGEAGGAEAAAEYRRLSRPRLFYLPLHALEVENAIRQRAFHARRTLPSGERTLIRGERDAALARVAQYLKRGALGEVLLDMDAAMDRARQLSAKHTDRLGVRAIDLLHVACALLLETEVFLTFDGRQFELATAEGMEAPLLHATD